MPSLRTYSDIYNEVAGRLDNNSIDAAIKRWVNTAYKNLAMSTNHPLHIKKKSFSTVAATDTYDLPVDFRFMGVVSTSQRRLVSEKHEELLYKQDAEARSGDPEEYTIVTSDTTPVSYTTGTVAVTSGGRTLTGSGTTFTSNVSDGDLITIGSNSYNASKVVSDTSIILVQKSFTTEAGSTYSVDKVNMPQIILYPNPGSVATVKYNYYKRIFDMQHDDDTPELPEEFNEGIVQGALGMGYQYDEETNQAQMAFTAYQNFIDKWKMNAVDIRESDQNSGIEPMGYPRQGNDF